MITYHPPRARTCPAGPRGEPLRMMAAAGLDLAPAPACITPARRDG
jgi:hypothetical protein